MKRPKRIFVPIVTACTLLVLILDAKTVLTGAQEGIEICIKTLVPTLFPFFVVSALFCNVFSSLDLRFLKPILRLCGLPKGSESLALIGMLGGYPVGAKAIADAYNNGALKRETGQRMLGFCSNAGPSFIFGIIACQFVSPWIPWLLLLVNILSAVITGYLLPHKDTGQIVTPANDQFNFTQIFENSIRAISFVCGWVILFRVALTFMNKWFLWILPIDLQIALAGILELSNGCIALNQINNEGLRFILSSGMLTFGGICVYLQTLTITKTLGIGMYFPGKVLQTLISIVLSCFIQAMFFEVKHRISITMIWIPLLLIFVVVYWMKNKDKKITVAFSRKPLYNVENQW